MRDARTRRWAVSRRRRAGLGPSSVPVLAGLAAMLAVAVCVSVSVGPVTIPLDHTAAVLARHLELPFGDATSREALVVDQIRLPRVLVAALVGAALGVAGATMQALFRNPLAEPGITGVSAGAAVGAVAAIASGAGSTLLLPAAAFVGALAALAVASAVAAASRSPGMSTLLLVGIALNALLGAVVSALVANAEDEQTLRGVVFWLQGDLDARTWLHVRLVLAPVLIGMTVIGMFARDLNTMLLGDDAARASGVAVSRTRWMLLVVASLLTGVAVSVSGVIGFVGLVVPHVVRLVAGPDHRLLLPASALLGGVFLVLADTVARLLLAPVTLQTGVVTALVGAPVFLLLVLRSRRSAL